MMIQEKPSTGDQDDFALGLDGDHLIRLGDQQIHQAPEQRHQQQETQHLRSEYKKKKKK